MKVKRRLLGYLVLLLAVTVTIIILKWGYPEENIGFSTGEVYSWNQGWEYVNQAGGVEKITLPAFVEEEPGTAVMLKGRIPDMDINGMTLCIRTSHQSIEARVDGKVIYEFGTDPSRYFSKSPGSRWNLISISPYARGKEIVLYLKSPFSNLSVYVNDILFGNKTEILFYLVKQDGLDLIVAGIVFLFGIICLLYCLIGFFFKRELLVKGMSLFYLSLFAVFAAVWMAGESRVLQFIARDAVWICNLSYFAMLLMPVPMIWFLEEYISGQHNKMYGYMVKIYTVAVMLCLGLHLWGKYDFYETIILIHGLLVIYVVLAGLDFLYEIRIRRNNQIKKIIWPFLVLIVFSVVEIFYFNFTRASNSASFFRVGILAFIVMYGIYFVQGSQRLIRQSRETAYYQKLAYKDLLTGGNNRTAYFRDIQEIFEEGRGLNGQVWLFLSDLNDLKYINDHYGHKIGDEALKKAYGCIQRSMGRLGTCYRIGGDEFACIILESTWESCREAMEELETFIAEENKNTAYPFFLASGIDQYIVGEDAGFDSLSIRVDQLMYRKKTEIKQRNQV